MSNTVPHSSLMMAMAAVASSLCLSAAAIEGEDILNQVKHRRHVRSALSDASSRKAALAEALADPDPAVRRHATFVQSGRDPDRPACGRKPHRTNVPLSQDPANDHEVSSVLSVRAEKGRFALPEKPVAADGLELWFSPFPADDAELRFWLNGIFLGQFRRTGPGSGQEFRLDAAAEAAWGGENALVVRDGTGAEVVRPFTVEVVKCGK